MCLGLCCFHKFILGMLFWIYNSCEYSVVGSGCICDASKLHINQLVSSVNTGRAPVFALPRSNARRAQNPPSILDFVWPQIDIQDRRMSIHTYTHTVSSTPVSLLEELVETKPSPHLFRYNTKLDVHRVIDTPRYRRPEEAQEPHRKWREISGTEVPKGR